MDARKGLTWVSIEWQGFVCRDPAFGIYRIRTIILPADGEPLDTQHDYESRIRINWWESELRWELLRLSVLTT